MDGRLPHSREEERKFDLMVERRVLQRKVNPKEIDSAKRAMKNAKQRTALVNKLIDKERKRRAVDMLATVKQAFAEAKCPVPLEVNWIEALADAAVVNERIRKEGHRPDIALVVSEVPKKQYRTRNGEVIELDHEMVTVFTVCPMFWQTNAWSEWTYVIADQKIVFTWTDLPPRYPDYCKNYPEDWTWFPYLRTEENLTKQSVVTWGSKIEHVVRFANSRTAVAVKAIALHQAVLQARKDARRRVPKDDESRA